MDRIVQALGVFVRYVPPGPKTRAFYLDGLGLPMIRTYGANPADIYWGGEATIFETITVEDKIAEPDSDPRTAACFPVFRVADLDAQIARLTGNGLSVLPVIEGPRGREAHLLDPDGHIVGLRERDPGSTLPQDVEARRRQRRGEAYNPGCASLPEGLCEIGWIVRHVADVARVAAFYRDALHLTPFGRDDDHLLFDLGDNVILELAPGGAARPIPQNRYHRSDVMLLRVTDTEGLRRRFAEHGGGVVLHKLPIHWGDLAYLSDPEGYVFGAEQAIHPREFAPGQISLPENLEMERRWRETLAAQNAG